MDKILLEVLAWLQTGYIATLAIAGIALASIIALVINWARARDLTLKAAAGNSRRIAARRYREQVWS